MRALIISSTQPRRPIGSLPWVRASIAAVDQLAKEGRTLIASVGTAAWDLVLCRAALAEVPIHLIAPVPGQDHEADQARILHDYRIRPELVSWEMLRSARSAGRHKDAWEQRDQAAFAAADKVYPVCVKPGGRIDGLLRQFPHKVSDRFLIEWRKPQPTRRSWDVPEDWNASGSWPDGALLHLTRASDGPWPGETMQSYWADIATSENRYPRDAFSTLCRILEERRIRGSQFRIRGGASTVSLTALAPSQTIGLFRWRSRYARYSFEPYGIALAREAVVRLGGRPVVYDDGARQGQSNAFSQGRGDDAHWESEQEWRVEGNLDFSMLEPAQFAAVVASDEEAAILRGRYPGLNVGSFQ